MKKDWNTYFGSIGDPTVNNTNYKNRYVSASAGKFYFGDCYFYRIQNSAIDIGPSQNDQYAMVEFSSFVNCFYSKFCYYCNGGGGIHFAGLKSVIDHVCSSFCASTRGGQSLYIGSGEGHFLSCSITNCGIDEIKGYSTIRFATSIFQIVENINMSANKCRVNAGYDAYSLKGSTSKYIIVTNCNSSISLNELTCSSPYKGLYSYVVFVQNRCGTSLVVFYENISLDNCIFLENNAQYGFDSGEVPSNILTIANSYVDLKIITGQGKVIYSNLRNDLFPIYRDLTDDKNCNNVYLVVARVKPKCTYRNSLYYLFTLSFFSNPLLINKVI